MIIATGRLFEYDDKNQLIHETFNDIDDTQISYTYDQYGNITSATKTYNQNIHKGDRQIITVTDTYTYSIRNKLELLTFNNEIINYDTLLNPLNLNGATLTYYRAHKLRTYSKNSITTTYDYNYQGLRTRKLVGSVEHQYLYDGDKVVREKITSGSTADNIIYLYGLNGVIGFRYNDTNYLYEKNIFNDVIAIYEVGTSSLTLKARYEYDGYGNCRVLNPDYSTNNTSSFIGNLNPYRYRSYYFDTETGYYYCKSRYYVPFLRRWLTPDNPSYLNKDNLNRLNIFAYCNNNPVMFTDEEGRNAIPQWVYWLFGGLVIVGCAALTITTDGAALPLLIEACVGSTTGFVFGGLDFENEKICWNWDKASKGFCWGAATGAISGFTNMSMASIAVAYSLSNCSSVAFCFITNGLNAVFISAFEAKLEHEKWSLIRSIITFSFGGFNSFIGDSWLLDFLTSYLEGIIDEVLDYYSLAQLYLGKEGYYV